MAGIRTEITEIVTGLGMLGFQSIERVLEAQPGALRNVTDDHFRRLASAYRSSEHPELFATAWDNGVVFARSSDGLRGRPPWSLEWKGGHRPPAYEQIPADLRVDHVYLISCKYGSKILINSSPSNVFDNRLAVRAAGSVDWYAEVAADAYQSLYSLVRHELAGEALPRKVTELSRPQRDIIRKALPRRLGGELAEAYQEMNVRVTAESVARWKRALDTPARREEMVWRLLRFQAAPYFILGRSARDAPIRVRVATPWDVRNRYEFLGFEIEAGARAQAVVGWRAAFRDRETDAPRWAAGHIEIRWSHGKFGQVPEAKIYLDTPYDEVPGYFRLDRDS
ncbi:MAG: hypothetical protein GY720_12350 [bacterium]|nr:hypothetical protein [bacterium]